MTLSSSRTTAGRMSRSFSSGTTTETKISRLIGPSRPSWHKSNVVVVRQRQRLVEIVDVVDLAAQNGNNIRRRRIAFEQDRPAVVDPALRQDRLDLPQRSHVGALPQGGHVARRVPAHSIETGAQRELRRMGGVAAGCGLVGPFVVRRVADVAQSRK